MPHPRHFNLLDGIDVPEPENLFDDYQGRTEAAKLQEMTIRDHINIAADLKVTLPVAATSSEKMQEAAPKTKSLDLTTIQEFRRMTPEQKKAWDE